MVMTHTAPIFTTQQCADAIADAELTQHQTALVKAVLDMRQGTPHEFAERFGTNSYKITFNQQLGTVCHRLAEILGWQKADGGQWVDLMLCFEPGRHRDEDGSCIWTVRGNWVGAL